MDMYTLAETVYNMACYAAEEAELEYTQQLYYSGTEYDPAEQAIANEVYAEAFKEAFSKYAQRYGSTAKEVEDILTAIDRLD